MIKVIETKLAKGIEESSFKQLIFDSKEVLEEFQTLTS
jgi:hypothetical protein